MKVCVIGGTGNISTSIVRLLLELGHDVVCFNRGVTAGLPDGARLIVGDRTDEESFERTMQRERFDAAIDMVCFNADQARSDIRAFREIGHFVMCSSVATYGNGCLWMPVSEDHPLQSDGPYGSYGRNKIAADNAFLDAYHREAFPVTIVKPSATYGPKLGLIRQVAHEFGWIDRIRKGKPIIVAGDGSAIQQFLHVDDAAPCFAHMLGRARCVGQIYNMVPTGFVTWADYHRTAMEVIGREVELVGVPTEDLKAIAPERFRWCTWFHNYFCNQKLLRDVPEFRPCVSLKAGVTRVLAAMEHDGRIPDTDSETWEDEIIAAQREVRDITTT